MTSNRFQHLALVSAITLGLAAPAFAQPAPAQDAGPRAAAMAEMKARHEAARQQRLEDLRTILKLRSDQEPALAAFVAAQQPAKRAGRRERPSEPMTTPQRLERMEARQAQMAERHEARRKAVATFYAVLSPDQQKTFDALQRLQGPRAKGHDGPGKRMMMRHMGGHGRPGAVAAAN
jgi:hypothetical protein